MPFQRKSECGMWRRSPFLHYTKPLLKKVPSHEIKMSAKMCFNFHRAAVCGLFVVTIATHAFVGFPYYLVKHRKGSVSLHVPGRPAHCWWVWACQSWPLVSSRCPLRPASPGGCRHAEAPASPHFPPPSTWSCGTHTWKTSTETQHIVKYRHILNTRETPVQILLRSFAQSHSPRCHHTFCHPTVYYQIKIKRYNISFIINRDVQLSKYSLLRLGNENWLDSL